MRTKRQQAEVKRWYWNRRNLKDWLRMAVWRVRSNGVMALRSGLLDFHGGDLVQVRRVLAIIVRDRVVDLDSAGPLN